ncbi:MAG: aconitase family protein, partial [Candidatus Omnitrophica bacterium]|nr:aconitase family protein [Candidatus Omnitrophota bacterium]
DFIDGLGMDGRFTISNMAVELGAKAGIMRADRKTKEWVSNNLGILKINAVSADEGASYDWVKEFDLAKISPQVAKPHKVDNVSPLKDVEGVEIAQGYIGTCTNGRLEDLEVACRILKGRQVKSRLIVAPISKKVFIQAKEKGLIDILISCGSLLLPPGCGPCVGTHAGVPADGENVISTANRNFRGRMGNPNSFIYLASPATVAASVLEGKISDPRKYLDR